VKRRKGVGKKREGRSEEKEEEKPAAREVKKSMGQKAARAGGGKPMGKGDEQVYHGEGTPTGQRT